MVLQGRSLRGPAFAAEYSQSVGVPVVLQRVPDADLGSDEFFRAAVHPADDSYIQQNINVL